MRKLPIEAGDKFNFLTAVRFVSRLKGGRQRWLFRCDCGVEFEAVAAQVKYGSPKSCGCVREVPKPTAINPGDKFNRLTAVKHIGFNRGRQQTWLFKCECDREKILAATQVKGGFIKSCGCLKKGRHPYNYVDYTGKVEKSCVNCNTAKPFDEFRIRADGRFNSYCKNCEKTRYATGKVIRIASGISWRRDLGKSARIKKMWWSVKNSAPRRGISFDLLVSDLELKIEQQGWKCAKTGIHFDLTTGEGRQPFGPSVDRIDNDRGYEPDNIQIVCNMYNFAKNHHSEADVLKFAIALQNHQLLSLKERLNASVRVEPRTK